MATELEGVQNELELKIRRLNALREAIAIESDADVKFTLQIKIEALEKEITGLRQESYGLAAVGGNSLLEQKIKGLSIDDSFTIGELYLVNCNRIPPRNNFWKAFDENTKRRNPFQFYFVLACPTQQPNSFAERMVYEILIDELESDFEAIHYVHQPNSRRVRIEDLPLGRNLKNSQREFKKYFAKRFNWSDSEMAFEDFINTGLPKLEYKYVTTIFDLNASKWDDILMLEYLDWIVDVFTHTHEDVPTFLFFFAIFIKDVHTASIPLREQKIVDSIVNFVNQNAERCSLINQLLPVPVDFLEDWIRELGEQNQGKIEEVVKIMVEGLPDDKKDKYEQTKELDMTDIERFQEIVYKVVMQ